MVSAAVRLHRHRARRQFGAQPDNAVSRESPPKDDTARLIETRDAADVHTEIDTQHGDRHRSLFSPDHVSLAPTPKEGRAIPKKTAHVAEQERPVVKAAREAWFEGQLDLDPARLVFLDETWTSTNMARRYGRSSRGERLRSPVPHGHWKTNPGGGPAPVRISAGRGSLSPRVRD